MLYRRRSLLSTWMRSRWLRLRETTSWRRPSMTLRFSPKKRSLKWPISSRWNDNQTYLWPSTLWNHFLTFYNESLGFLMKEHFNSVILNSPPMSFQTGMTFFKKSFWLIFVTNSFGSQWPPLYGQKSIMEVNGNQNWSSTKYNIFIVFSKRKKCILGWTIPLIVYRFKKHFMGNLF